MDEGPIIVQGVVPVISSDTPDRLATRVLQVEHRIYPLAVRLVAEGRPAGWRAVLPHGLLRPREGLPNS